jgi:hypothetical protein
MKEADKHIIRTFNGIFLSFIVYDLNIPSSSVFPFNLAKHKEEVYLCEWIGGGQ